MELITLIVMSILVEAIVEILKSIVDENGINKTAVTSIVVGILMAFTVRLDIFTLLNIATSIPYVGVVAAGLIISRGANFAHDLISRIQGVHLEPVEIEEKEEL